MEIEKSPIIRVATDEGSPGGDYSCQTIALEGANGTIKILSSHCYREEEEEE